MKVLGIDPGVTTGYFLVTPDGERIESGNLSPEDISESILATFAQDPEIIPVIEKIPVPTLSSMNFVLRSILSWLEVTFPHAIWIGPGQWKTVTPIFGLEPPQSYEVVGYSQHEKDAYRLAMFYLFKEQI